MTSKIKALLNPKGKQAQDAIIKVDDIEVNLEEFTVYKADRLLDFPKKEFELLLLLISKPNKLFTREEIFKDVWGGDYVNAGRTIDVHIRKIREKLGEGHIKTIKGMGYKLATK